MSKQAISSIIFKDTVSKPSPTNHVFIVDVSGSMYSTLPKIRHHLKTNLASLVKFNDTVSVLYFSSKGQFGAVFTAQKVRQLDDLTEINKLIDRFIKPTGCTGFVEPLQLAIDIVDDLPAENANSLIFMTDGYDNEWSDKQILEVSSVVNKYYDSKTIIEYGWYCNHDLLVKMADAMAAIHVFSENYEKYEPEFEQAVEKSGAKRKVIEVAGALQDGMTNFLYRDGEDIVVASIGGDKIFVPDYVDQVWLTGFGAMDSVVPGAFSDTDLYMMLYYALYANNAQSVWKILAALGDVALIKAYSTTFSKQDRINMVALVKNCLNDHRCRFKMGKDHNAVPDADTDTILDVLNFLSDSGAQLVTKPEILNYSGIGGKRVQRADDSDEKLADAIAQTEDKAERKKLAMELATNQTWDPEFLPKDELGLTPITNLVLNSTRPNISVQTQVKGIIPVPDFIQEKYGLPDMLESHIWRNYTIVRDGIVNLRVLPVVYNPGIMNQEFFESLSKFGVTADQPETLDDGRTIVCLSLENVPLMNLSMVQNLDSQEFAQSHLKLQELKARQKVMKFYREELVGKVNALQLAGQYGEEAAEYLSSKGIRDYGFSPLTDAREATDMYYATELNVKIKGLSSLPSVAAVQKKLDAGKALNIGDQMMAKVMADFNTFRNSEMVKASTVGDEILKEFITKETDATIQATRALNKKLASVLYGIVVGGAWFEDVDFQDPVIKTTYQGKEVIVTLELVDTEIKI